MMLAAPASAHTPTWSVDCDSVSVGLKYYDSNGGNTVTVTAGGQEILDKEFGTGLHIEDLKLPAHTEPLEVRLVVDAIDDNGDKHDWDLDQTKTSPVCEGQEPSPEPSTPTEEPTPTPEPSASEPAEPTPSTPPPSTSAPAVEPAGDSSPAPTTDLAETGSSGSTTLIAGIAAAVVAAGGGLLMVARKRRSAKV